MVNTKVVVVITRTAKFNTELRQPTFSPPSLFTYVLWFL